jgi:release factor glutamine methyltransferase
VSLSWSEAVTRATRVLAEARCDSPRLDAELLLAAAVGQTRTALYLTPGAPIAGERLDFYESLVRRRAAREPVAYILGFKAFRRLSLAVDRRVLIPRPETEVLVERSLALLPEAARVVDVGSGSGAIALALKDERPDLRVVGLDSSRDAVAVARGNASALGLAVIFVVADLLSGFAAGSFDGVVANLPYVRAGERLQPEIARYEPARALFGGVDGLDLIRRLIGMLGDAAYVALEVGEGQASEVASMVAAGGFGSVSRVPDLAGIERVVVGRR